MSIFKKLAGAVTGMGRMGKRGKNPFSIAGIAGILGPKKIKENKSTMGYKEGIGDHNQVNEGNFKPFMKPYMGPAQGVAQRIMEMSRRNSMNQGNNITGGGNYMPSSESMPGEVVQEENV
tara:strand:- start:468 stop:827 length:360 start_codon:yes stop_codon:yes gene_type:complete